MPPANSPLESLFILVFVQRQQADLLATRALVEATLADEERKDAVEAFEKYCTKMFPFWDKATDPKNEEQRKALMELVKRPLRIDMAKVYKTQANAMKARARSRIKGNVRIPSKFRMKKRNG